MDVKEVIKQEASDTDFCSENERELLTKDPIKKVMSETVTSNNDCDTGTEIQEGDVDYKFSEHNQVRCNETIKESELETEIKIKQEHVWLETNSTDAPCITGDIKDETDEDFCSIKPSLYKESVSNYSSDIFSSEDLGNEISFHTKKDSSECESDRQCQNQESVVTDISSVESNAYSKISHDVKIVGMVSCFEQSNKTFSELSNLKKHKLIHEDFKPHRCNVCKKRFSQSSNLKKHKLIHEGIKPHKCDICNNAFTQLSCLQTHKLMHEGIKPHKCNICNKAFTQVSNLKTHKLIHEGIEPHKCSICHKTFTQLSNMKRHKLIHVGIKPHECNICNKTFTQLSSLKKHKLIHEGIKPHKCDLCNNAFTDSSTLKKHKLIHEGIKPHMCNICNKAFTELSNLKRHTLTHEGLKPYKCNFCSKAFTHLLSLKRHSLIHEDKKPH